MASVDSGVETSNESNDSSIVQEPKNLDSPIEIHGGVNVLMSKACAFGNSDTEEKSYSFTPEFSEIEAPATLTWCKQPESEKSEIMSNAPRSSVFLTTARKNIRTRNEWERRMTAKMYSDDFKRSNVIRHEKRVRRKFDCPYYQLKCLVTERKLHIAASTNNEELLAALLNESGVDPNGSDNHLRTPLHLASCRGYTNIVRMLLEKGANPNLKDALGNTPLHLAACTNHVEVVTLLLKAGTDINSYDYYGRSPLQLAQSKLKLLHQSCSNNEDSLRIKQEVQKVIEMILTFLQKKGQETEAGMLNEVLNSFQSRFTISQTKEEVKTDVRDLLDSLNNLNLNKSDG